MKPEKESRPPQFMDIVDSSINSIKSDLKRAGVRDFVLASFEDRSYLANDNGRLIVRILGTSSPVLEGKANILGCYRMVKDPEAHLQNLSGKTNRKIGTQKKPSS